MKAIIFLILLMWAFISNAQKEIKLMVKQPPEFSFLVSNQDTTIVKGRSILLGTDLVIFGGSSEYYCSWSPAATLDDSTFFHPLASPMDTTVYILKVTDKFGCSFSVNYKVNVRESMVNSEIIAESQKLMAVLFPNPNDGKFKVKLTGFPTKKIDLTICDTSGKIIKRKNVHNFNGDHTEILQLELISGVYTLFINSDNVCLSRQFIIN
jgi:hypothetical protein